MGSNRLKWVVVLLIVVVIVIAAINKRNQPPAVVRDARIQEPAAPTVGTESASADTATETLRTVQAQYGEQRRRNDRLQDEVAAIRKAVEARQQPSSTDNRLTDRLTNIEGRLNTLLAGNTDSQSPKDESAVLSEFGFRELAQQYRISGPGGTDVREEPRSSLPTTTAPSDSPGYVRLVPLVSNPVDSNDLGPKSELKEREMATGAIGLASSFLDSESDRPVYTIPARSTLFDSIAMTALIGRVPIGGQVHDPFPVKLIVGRENLAANGHEVPGVDGVIFDGIARGDWALSCVSVELTGATYIHQDGTISHMSAQQAQQLDSTSNNARGAGFGNNNRSIGYVSDTQGVPCIRGDRITDAYKQAALLSSLGMAQGYATYRADSQRTTVVSGGAVVEGLTGKPGEFSRFGMAATGLGEVLNIFKERLEDTFDAIYVPPSQTLAIHVSRDLMINHNPNARRISYATMGDSYFFDE